jgi:hypothetical protein
MDDADVAGTYNWVADADGKGTAGWQEAFEPVADGTYTLMNPATGTAATGTDATGLSIARARKSDASNIVYIKLGGKVTGEYTLKATAIGPASITEGAKFKSNDYFGIHPTNDSEGAASAGPAPGFYAVVRIKGLYDDVTDERVTALKQTNQAYLIYQYDTLYTVANKGVLASIPKVPQKGSPTTWVPSADQKTASPVVWALNKDTRSAEKVFGFPIWNGGTGSNTYDPKTSKIEITEYEDSIYSDSYNNNAETPPDTKTTGYKATFVVDYSDVDFAEPIPASPAG